MSDVYKCLRCGYVSDLKLNLIRHLKRKNTCSPNLSDTTCDELLTAFVVNKPYSCKNNCGKSFQTTAYLSQHMKKCNAVNIPRNDGINCEVIERILNEIKSLKEMILKKEHTTTNNTINNNTTNNTNTTNITINVFGKEDRSYINHPDFYMFFLYIIKDHKNGLARYIEYKYFNDCFPQNQNIKKHKDPNKLLIRESNGWTPYDRSDVVNLTIDEIEYDFNSIINCLPDSEKSHGRDFGVNEQYIVKNTLNGFLKYVGYSIQWSIECDWMTLDPYIPESDLEIEDAREMNAKNSINGVFDNCINVGHRVKVDHRVP